MSDETASLEELSAYADGQLPPRAAARVARHLRDHPEDAERLHAYLRQDALLRRAFAPAGEAPLPEPLGAALRRSAERRGSPALRRGAVVAALLALLALASWQESDAPSVRSDEGRTSFVEMALRAYRGSADTLEVLPPRSSGLGLAELRLDSRRAVRAGELELVESVYRSATGERVVLYEGPQSRPAEPLLRVRERGPLHVVEWSVGDRHYALLSDRSVGGLTRLALQIRQSLGGQVLAGTPAALEAGGSGGAPAPSGAPSPTAGPPVTAPTVRPGGETGALPSRPTPGSSHSGGAAGRSPAVVSGAEM